MNFEKIGYSLIGSLIAGALIQKNFEMDQHYFFIISIGLWVLCIGAHWWNCKKEERIKNIFESQNLELRDVLVKNIIESISESVDKEIECIREEIGKFEKKQKEIQTDLYVTVIQLDKHLTEILQVNRETKDTFSNSFSANEKAIIQSINREFSGSKKLLKEGFTNTEILMNRVVELSNNIVEKTTAFEVTSTTNNNLVCDEIRLLKRSVDCNYGNVVSELGKVADRMSGNICSQLNKQSNSVQDLVKQKLDFMSQQNAAVISNLNLASKDTNEKLQGLKDDLIENGNGIRESIKNETECRIDNFTKLMKMLNDINKENKDKISEIYDGLRGIMSNMQSALEATERNIENLKNTDDRMYDLLEDAKSKIQDVEIVIREEAEKIEADISQNMDSQKDIISEEKDILNSYDELLSRINDEVIANMISDSNTMLKCIRDCYNLLESQRRLK